MHSYPSACEYGTAVLRPSRTRRPLGAGRAAPAARSRCRGCRMAQTPSQSRRGSRAASATRAERPWPYPLCAVRSWRPALSPRAAAARPQAGAARRLRRRCSARRVVWRPSCPRCLPGCALRS
eukprot:scaffold87965_cov54-Phaeocystis_antarctica.AAC.1